MFNPNTSIPTGITIINLILLGYMVLHPEKVSRVVEKVDSTVHKTK